MKLYVEKGVLKVGAYFKAPLFVNNSNNFYNNIVTM